MVYAKEVIIEAASVICPKYRGVCLSKFECDKIKQYIKETVKEKNND